jgi:hypothetical protein
MHHGRLFVAMIVVKRITGFASSGFSMRSYSWIQTRKLSSTVFESFTVIELKEKLRSAGLAMSGRKSDLILRLQILEANQASTPITTVTPIIEEVATIVEAPPSVFAIDSPRTPEPMGIASRTVVAQKLNFLDLSLDELRTLLVSWSHPAYRANQVSFAFFI